MVTVFFYLHIFTGSVGKRILIVVPVDTLYRTSIISSSTVLLLNPFANLSLAPLSLFSIYCPDLGVADCWVSAEFLRAPIPRKESGSNHHHSHQPMPIYFGMRVIITENRDKAGGFFNGNLGVVHSLSNHTLFARCNH